MEERSYVVPPLLHTHDVNWPSGAAASPLDDTDALAEAIEAAGASADIEPGLGDLKAAAASGGKAKAKGKKK